MKVEEWGQLYYVGKDLLEDESVFPECVKRDVQEKARMAGYEPIEEPVVKVFEHNPMAPVPEAWEDLSDDRLPRMVRVSVKVRA